MVGYLYRNHILEEELNLTITMKTIILPGYSVHNRKWAEEIAVNLRKNIGNEVVIHEWRHWKDPSLSLSISKEIKKIIEEIGIEKVNIIAKSVGVYMAFKLIPIISEKVDKIIFCGIASVGGGDRNILLQAILKKISVRNILCLQNEQDKFVPFTEAEKFYHSVEPSLKVISKPRTDHEYPYFSEFKNFLES
ncbi:hypothetical protein A2685_02300 [Candidatus Woesebacteria bacterium RIFCSPHIGHO2_01_FULL_37_10]|uniref:AB hydrolase-1 domain-containing protein n=1 Tax=Candidatus Woesebacteria bacterium RIFCSPHIGHO2_01_FULL_37_10 TaxID=1802489 RepID=A0A1F7XVX0_9BACT|nr:MAG: hypothetical protein A2685_02300 [Candidatus Woesebacteria bacterium RIFCSPHIGHO2_01_FULL_37_10]